MQVYTSYFARNGDNPHAKAISLTVPQGIRIPQIKALAPTWDILNAYKRDGDWCKYTEAYISKLDNLGIDYVSTLITDGDILLCYESPEKHCHRHLLAAWLRQHAINAYEI